MRFRKDRRRGPASLSSMARLEDRALTLACGWLWKGTSARALSGAHHVNLRLLACLSLRSSGCGPFFFAPWRPGYLPTVGVLKSERVRPIILSGIQPRLSGVVRFQSQARALAMSPSRIARLACACDVGGDDFVVAPSGACSDETAQPHIRGRPRLSAARFRVSRVSRHARRDAAPDLSAASRQSTLPRG